MIQNTVLRFSLLSDKFGFYQLYMISLQLYISYCQDVPASLQYDSEKLIGFYLLNEKMNLLLLNAASGSKLEQALEKLVDFGMDAGKDIFVAILIYSVGRFIIKQIVY